MSRCIAFAVLAMSTLVAGACRKPEPAPEATPSPTASASPASILREAPEPLVVEEVSEPFAITIPFGDAGLVPPDGADAAIASVVASEQFRGGGAIVLRGHSDSVGSDNANLEASRRRAEIIAGALRDAGVEEDRISIIALGEMRPIAPNAHLDGSPDEAGRSRNRRVDVEVHPPAKPDPQVDATPAAVAAEAPEKT